MNPDNNDFLNTLNISPTRMEVLNSRILCQTPNEAKYIPYDDEDDVCSLTTFILCNNTKSC